MSLRGRIPVEQLDDERVTNIERKLVVAVSDMRAQAPAHGSFASRRMLAFAGAAMAVVVAGVAGYKLRSVQSTPPVLGDTPQQLALHGGTLDLGDAQLTSTPDTDATIERTRERTVVHIRRGTLDFAVTHDPGRVFVVRAGDTEIEDIGTKFRVQFDGIAAVAVSVSEGEVRVNRKGSLASLTAGQQWSAQPDVVGAVVAAAPRVADEPAPPAVVAQVRSADAPRDDQPGTNQPRDEHPGNARPAVVQPASDQARADHTGNGPSRGDEPTVTSAPSVASPRGDKPQTRRSSARVALEKLALEEPLDVGATDPNTAIAKYLDLAVSMGDAQDKTQVLYSIAVVQHRARQDNAALYTLSGVIKRQGGKAYRAALWLNVRIECMQHFDDECRQASDLYLRRVPDGPAAGIAQAILDEIRRG